MYLLLLMLLDWLTPDENDCNICSLARKITKKVKMEL